MNSSGFPQITPFIATYAVAHLIADAASAFFFFGSLKLNGNLILFMLLYNATAFILQAPLGYLIDKALNPKLAAIVGLLFIALSFLFWSNPYVGLIFVGLGNALFHVGGGSLVLSLQRKKATFSGIFVAPGGIGLATGTFLSFSQVEIVPIMFPVILLVFSFILYFIRTPDFRHAVESDRIPDYTILFIALIMIPVAVRSLIGLSMEFPWKENQYLSWGLISALAMGKIFGGILADKFGLLRTGVGGLLISVPLLSFFPVIPFCGLMGAFVFNFTMPVTLLAILSVMPKNKGLSFGLTSAALFIGSLPTILGKDMWLKNNSVVFSSILMSAIVLFAVLISIQKNNALKD